MEQAPRIDWSAQAFLAAPYPAYAALRAADPVHFDAARGSWMLTRYRDVETVLRDDERFSAEQAFAPSMLVTDPPANTRQRHASATSTA